MSRLFRFLLAPVALVGLALWLSTVTSRPLQAARPATGSPVAAATPQQLTGADPATIAKSLTDYLTAHPQTAEEYVVSRFKTHDVVFLGESHVTRQREVFLQRLIPLLYKAGIHTLGYEMGCSEDQALIDRLINAPAYDEAAAFEILAHWDLGWTFQEYADVYRAAWTLNHSLPKGAPKFRILGIDIRPDYHRLPVSADPMVAFRPTLDPKTAETLRGIIVGGTDRDLTRNTRMAEILRREVLSQGQKALMFNGAGHSTTRHLRPNRSGAGERRMVVGYMIHQEVGDRVMGVLLGGPGTLFGGSKVPGEDPILNGVLASLSAGRDSVGFDTKGSPLGTQTVMAAARESLKMEDLWDGLTFISMKTPWTASTINTTYLTEARVKQAKAEGTIPNLPAITLESLKKDIAGAAAHVTELIKKGAAY
jgi:hypothetical protein